MVPSLTVFFYWYEVRVYQILLLTHSCNMMAHVVHRHVPLLSILALRTFTLEQQIPNTCKPLPWFHSKLPASWGQSDHGGFTSCTFTTAHPAFLSGSGPPAAWTCTS